MSPTGAPAFLLGLAAGLAFLPLTAYRHVSPSWLKWLLMATGLLLIGRYAVTAYLYTAATVNMTAVITMLVSCLWLVGFIGFTLPAAFAVDQIIRHPAMTPKKLLWWYVPLPVVVGVPLVSGHHFILVMVQTVACLGFAGACLTLCRKLPSPPIRRALLGLVLAYGGLGTLLILSRCLLGFALVSLLYPEMAALAALWYEYETSARLQREPMSL